MSRPVLACCLLAAVTLCSAFDEGFEGAFFPPAGWTTVNADTGTRCWQRLDIGGRTGPASAYCGWEGFYRRNNDWLITPRCSVAARDLFSFYVHAADAAYRESVEVYVSTGGPRMSEFTRMMAFGTSSTEYERHVTILSALAGQRVFFAFVYRSHNQYAVLLDDLHGPAVWVPQHDVGIDSVLSPPRDLRAGHSFRPACRVRNFAATTEQVPLSCVVGQSAASDTTVALGALASVVVEFPAVTIEQPETCAVTFATTLGTDECPWNDTAVTQVVMHYFESRGGPDAFGYSWFDSDDPAGPAFDWQELSPDGTVLGAGDDTLWRLELAWPVEFYGYVYAYCWVSTNGWLGFGPPAQTSPADSNTPLPSASLPDRAVYPYWDDLAFDDGTGAVWYRYFGDSLLVVEWRNGRHRRGDNPGLDFEAKVFRSGAIEFHYAGVNSGDTLSDAGRSATVGIEDGTGTVGLQYLYDGSIIGNRLEPGRAIRFLWQPPGVQEQEPLRTRPKLSAMPSCTRGAVRIEAIGIHAATGDARILDLGGRVRCVLPLTRTGPDQLGATWNGKDANGCALPDGVYFCEVTTSGVTLRQKVVLAK